MTALRAGAVLPPQAPPEERLMSTSSAPPASAFLHSVLPKGEQAVSSPLAFQNLAAIFCVCVFQLTSAVKSCISDFRVCSEVRLYFTERLGVSPC